MTNAERINNLEFAAILERNGDHTAAADVLDGVSHKEATRYLVGHVPRYDDGEGRWLHDYIESLHNDNG